MIHEPGIYFGLPMQDYLDDHSFNSGKIVDVLISLQQCWSNSWMNPHSQRETTKAQENGTAFHTRLLEGQEEFDKRYAVEITKDDYPEAVAGVEALKEKCRELNLPVGGTIAQLSDRIKLAGFTDIKTWYHVEKEYLEKIGKKITLPRRQIGRIISACETIEANPENLQYLRDGFQEVTIFYVEPNFGVPLKIRMDYLNFIYLLEAKSFSNPRRKHLKNAISSTITDNEYLIKAGFYCFVLEGMKELLRQDKADIFATEEMGAAARAFVAEMIKTDRHRYIWLFQQSDEVQHLDFVEFAEEIEGETTLYYSLAREYYMNAIKMIAEALVEFGVDKKWHRPVVLRKLHDDDLPAYLWGGALKAMRDQLR